MKGQTRTSKAALLRAITRSPEQEDTISFAGGFPAQDLFPIDQIRGKCEYLVRERTRSALQYGDNQGLSDLRDLISLSMRESIGVEADSGQVVVTHGAQQGIDLVARAILGAGDVVVVERPSYPAALAAFELTGATCVTVPMDEYGICTEWLERLLLRGLRIELLYTVPNFHNPTGITMTLERRNELVNLADRFDFLIVEDDPYRELRFSGAALPSLVKLSRRVVYVGTFSKILVPGLRVGYVVAPNWLVDTLVELKLVADIHTSLWPQLLAAELIADTKWLRQHVDQMIRVYGRRARGLGGCVQRFLGDMVTFEQPMGGMFLWLQLGVPVSADDLLSVAAKHGVSFAPGAMFYVDPSPGERRMLRLNFAAADRMQSSAGMSRLRRALDQCVAKSGALGCTTRRGAC